MHRERLRPSGRSQRSAERRLNRREFLGASLAGAAASLLPGCVSPFARRPRLVVWSCGGNYDLLVDFSRRFGEIARCAVTYSSAPVEHLIAVLASRPRGVDVLVGRSGPGWAELGEKGRLAGKPEVFALDPYVIIVPPGNPGGIRGIADLKREDVKTVYSPTASGPSGKVPRFLLEAADEVIEPGISAGYVRNAIEAHDCGWKVFPAIIEGRAHATVTRLSMTTVPENRGKVEVIPIPVKAMAAMKDGRGAIPQRAACIAEGRNLPLAERYLEELRGDLGLELCSKHGFIHRLAPEADEHRPLFKMSAGPGPGGGGPGKEKGAGPRGKDAAGERSEGR